MLFDEQIREQVLAMMGADAFYLLDSIDRKRAVDHALVIQTERTVECLEALLTMH